MPPMPDAMEPDIHGVGTHWIRGFMAFQLARCTRSVVLMVPLWPESGSRKVSAQLRSPGA
jgi:hypothetical protein